MCRHWLLQFWLASVVYFSVSVFSRVSVGVRHGEGTDLDMAVFAICCVDFVLVEVAFLAADAQSAVVLANPFAGREKCALRRRMPWRCAKNYISMFGTDGCFASGLSHATFSGVAWLWSEPSVIGKRWGNELESVDCHFEIAATAPPYPKIFFWAIRATQLQHTYLVITERKLSNYGRTQRGRGSPGIVALGMWFLLHGMQICKFERSQYDIWSAIGLFESVLQEILRLKSCANRQVVVCFDFIAVLNVGDGQQSFYIIGKETFYIARLLWSESIYQMQNVNMYKEQVWHYMYVFQFRKGKGFKKIRDGTSLWKLSTLSGSTGTFLH